MNAAKNIEEIKNNTLVKQCIYNLKITEFASFKANVNNLPDNPIVRPIKQGGSDDICE